MYVTYEALGVVLQAGIFLIALLSLVVTIVIAIHRSHK